MYPCVLTKVCITILTWLFDILTIDVKHDQALPTVVSVEHDLDPNRYQKHHESVVVPDTDTVVDPWAVMVEAFHTSVADGAVPGAG